MPVPEMHSASFSPDRRYRYWLESKLGDRDGVCMFLMLNPSTADEVRSDPTVTRCKGFARGWGYGSLWVCNIFALRSTRPDALIASPDPSGPENDRHILEYARKADRVVCAWGNHGAHRDRGERVLRMLEDRGLSARMCHLGLTKHAQPRHPLYLRASTRPVRFHSTKSGSQREHSDPVPAGSKAGPVGDSIAPISIFPLGGKRKTIINEDH